MTNSDDDFGNYRIEKPAIGRGAMASVYLATQRSLGLRVVLKILYPHLAEDQLFVRRFENEAEQIARLNHPNIVRVLDRGRREDVLYIVLEFVEGMDLGKWIQENDTPPVEIALLMLRDICSGLEHAHLRGIVHRDIKPANMMLSGEGAIKIMDFGLALSMDRVVKDTIPGTVLGTAYYMSPEQATALEVDARADIWSVGVVAYELFGGTRPFPGDTFSKVLHELVHSEPRSLIELNPAVPQDVAALISRMLIKDRDKRLQTIREARILVDGMAEAMGLRRGIDEMREYMADPKGSPRLWERRRRERANQRSEKKVSPPDPHKPAPWGPVRSFANSLRKFWHRAGPWAPIAGAAGLLAIVISVVVVVKMGKEKHQDDGGNRDSVVVVPVDSTSVVNERPVDPLAIAAAFNRNDQFDSTIAFYSDRAKLGPISTARGVRARELLAVAFAELGRKMRSVDQLVAILRADGSYRGDSLRYSELAMACLEEARKRMNPLTIPADTVGRNGPPIEVVRSDSAKVDPAAPATLTVRVTPYGALYVDEKLIGSDRSFYETSLGPGEHKVQIINRQYKPSEITWTVVGGSGQKLERTADFKATLGTLRVRVSQGWGEIWINGSSREVNAPGVLDLPPGSYQVKLVPAPGLISMDGEKTVVITTASETVVEFTLKKSK